MNVNRALTPAAARRQLERIERLAERLDTEANGDRYGDEFSSMMANITGAVAIAKKQLHRRDWWNRAW